MIQSLEGMDLTDRIREMSGRIAKRLNSIKTEEATKTALVLPFITHVLGFNVFDPDEVVPEYTADVGTKKGEKVDYAIVANGSPIMIFECKHYGVDLTKEPASQLYRYFSVTEARLGVLTDGVTYRFYSDIDEPNKMDRRPFLELNMLDAESIDADEIKRFTKPAFDLEKILDTSKDLKYTREVLRLLAAEWANPSEALVRHFAGQIYEGVKTKAVIEQFERATRKAMHQFLTGRISDRLKSALSSTDDAEPVVSEAVAEPEPTDNDVVTTDNDVVTTEEEWRAYYVVTAILTPDVPADRVTLRDGKHYCSVLLDNTNRQPICRLHFNTAQKRLGLVDANKSEERVPVDDVSDIFAHAGRIRETVQRYLEKAVQPAAAP
jgi:hypothetical protein